MIRITSSLPVLAFALVLAACTAGRTPDADAGNDARMTIDLDAIVQGDMGATHCDPGTINCAGVCTHVASDPMNCGSCGNACPMGVGCAIGECSCHAPMLACDGLCIDPQSDHDHCGACGHACDATQVCSLGECIVMCTAADHEVCVSTDTSGTRTQICADLMNDSNNCGTCNTHCAGGATCYMGSCQCPAGERACSGTCTDVSSDPLNCGSCLSSCGGADGTCSLGVCTACGGGGTLCGSPARCYDTMTSTLHCGTCGHACGPGQTCTGGVCGCTAPLDACGTTTCYDLTTATHHCGDCATDCGVGGACAASTCTCASGFTMCGAACADLMRDHEHCGDCTNACGATEACVSGSCVAYVPYHGWTSPVAGCDTSSWNATATTPIGGSYGYNTGDSDACRMWKLAATICTTMPVAYGYTPPGDWSCASWGGFTDPVFGTFCAHTGTTITQYTCSDCYGACNAGGCFAGTYSIRDCTGSEVTQP